MMLSAHKRATKCRQYYITNARFAQVVDGVDKNFRETEIAINSLQAEFQDLEIQWVELTHFVDGLLGRQSSPEFYLPQYVVFNVVGYSIFLAKKSL